MTEREALEKLASKGCGGSENIASTCFRMGRFVDAQYSAFEVCAPCFAWAVLTNFPIDETGKAAVLLGVVVETVCTCEAQPGELAERIKIKHHRSACPFAKIVDTLEYRWSNVMQARFQGAPESLK